MLRAYLIGCIAYGCLVLYGILVDKKVSDRTILQAMLLTPIWPVIFVLVINNLRRNNK